MKQLAAVFPARRHRYADLQTTSTERRTAALRLGGFCVGTASRAVDLVGSAKARASWAASTTGKGASDTGASNRAGKRGELLADLVAATFGTHQTLGPLAHSLEHFESLLAAGTLIFVERHNVPINIRRVMNIPPAWPSHSSLLSRQPW
jgi:hypothetical protein